MDLSLAEFVNAIENKELVISEDLIYRLIQKNMSAHASHAIKKSGIYKSEFTDLVGFKGDKQMLEFLYNIGCPIKEGCAREAAINGHVNILEFLVNNELPVESDLWIRAACKNHLPVIYFLDSKGLNDYKWALNDLASAGSSIEVFSYLKKKGANIGWWLKDIARNNGHSELADWLADNDAFPRDEPACIIS